MPFNDLLHPHRAIIKGIEDDYVLARFSYTQTINRGFIIDFEISSPDPNLDLEKYIGKPVSIHVASHGEDGLPIPSTRILNGVIEVGRWVGETRGTIGPSDEVHYLYEFQAGPFLGLGRYRVDSKVFTNKTPADIIKEVAGKHASGLGKVQALDSAGSKPQFEHFIQYRESDHDFCVRMAERYGINMLYQMSDDAHDLVLYDSNAAVCKSLIETDCSPGNTLLFANFTRRRAFRTSAVEMADYDQFKPNSQQTENRNDVPAFGALKWEEFRYPAGYPDGIDRATIVDRRLDALKSESEQLTAVCNSIEVTVGQRYKITGHPSDAVNGSYAVTSYSLTVENFSDDGDPRRSVSARVTLLPDATQLAPRRVIDEPQHPGIVTAKVVDGSENDPKKMGRIKVRYPFVRTDDSFWCRVAQGWAGPGLGTWVNHRIGHEVVVAFEHGDINRPIVMGSVYNGENGIPWGGDLGKQVSGWRSQSPAGYNEIAMFDTPDAELLTMTAQKDMTVTVLNDQTEAVTANQSESVGGNYAKVVSGTSEWKTSRTTYIQSTDKMTVESPKEIELICGGSTIRMTPTTIELTTTHCTTLAQQTINMNAGTSMEAAAGRAMALLAGSSLAASAGSTMSLETKKLSHTGSDEVSVSTKKYMQNSETDSEFKAGGNFNVKADSKFSVKASGSATIKGQKVDVN